MDISLWWTFFIGTMLICGSPGPNMLQVMSTSARHGFRHAFFAMAGCFLPVFFFIFISLIGIGAVLAVFPAIFDLLRYLGAAYLIYIGLNTFRAPVSTEEAPIPAIAPRAMFRQSLLVGFSNPKAILFATAYFPQFLNPDAPQAMQFAILLGTFSVVEIAWYMIYATGGAGLSTFMRKARVQRAFNRSTGGLFVLFGILLAAKAR